jgi:hypothetical protein
MYTCGASPPWPHAVHHRAPWPHSLPPGTPACNQAGTGGLPGWTTGQIRAGSARRATVNVNPSYLGKLPCTSAAWRPSRWAWPTARTVSPHQAIRIRNGLLGRSESSCTRIPATSPTARRTLTAHACHREQSSTQAVTQRSAVACLCDSSMWLC